MNDPNGSCQRVSHLLITLVAAITVGSALGPLRIASGQQLEDVFAAWKKREESIHTGRFEWTETLLRTKEALADSPIRVEGDVPAEGLTCEYKRSLLFSGHMMRFEEDAEEWVISPKHVFELVDVRKLSVWNGKVAKSMKTIEGESWADSGNVSDREILLKTQDMTPLALAFRPFIWRNAGDDPFVLAKERGRIEDDECVIMWKRTRRGREEWWLDPAKEYVVRRIIGKVGDVEVRRQDIQYQKDSRFGWVPSRWTRTSYSGEGKLVASSKGQVVKYQLNAEVDPDQFELEFPERYLVYDAIANEEYIVRNGGEKRPVLLEERSRDITVDDLMTTEPGRAGLVRESSSVAWLSLGVAIVIVIAALCAVIIRARQRAA